MEGLTPSNHTPWTLAVGLCEPKDFSFCKWLYSREIFTLRKWLYSLRKSGILVDQPSFLLPPGQRSGSRQLPSFPFSCPLLPHHISAIPVTSACKVFPQIGPLLLFSSICTFTTGPALGPLHGLFLLFECFFPAVTTSFISFALKNVCHGCELQEGNDYVYLDHCCAASS